MRRLVSVLVLVAASSAIAAQAENITYSFTGFNAEYLLSNNNVPVNGLDTGSFTIQVYGNTNSIVHNSDGSSTNAGLFADIDENGSYFWTITTPVNVYLDPALGIYSVQVTEGPGVEGSDILGIISPTLPAPYNLAQSGMVSGNTSFQFNNPMNVSVGTGPGATQEVVQLTGIDGGGNYTAACSNGDRGSGSCSADGGGKGPGGVAATPEPSTFAMFGCGALGLFGIARRKVSVAVRG